jgi:thiol-disulfide isomerase/thioredoxin
MSRAAVSKTNAPDRRRLIIYAVITLAVVAVIVAVGLINRSSVPKSASEAPITSHLKVGDTAPEFAVQTNAGMFDLNSVSTPVLLEIFATWCPHCQRETVVLNDIASKYAGKVAIVAVSGSPTGIDGNSPESQADVNTFGQQFQVRYPIAFDGDLKVAQQYIGSGFPTLVMIDKNKKVTWITAGETAEPTIVKQIKATL